jgi:DnaJ-class molecular chaperone
MNTKAMQRALELDGEKLRQLTGEDHGPVPIEDYLELETCPTCGGEGSLEIPDPQRDDPYYCRVVQCGECNGSGWV